MSEFEEALAEAVQDGIARGGLPGAADAVRRGRRRSLRARGGVTVLGVAVVAGALGGAGMLGGGAGTVGAASGLGGHAGEGILPAAQWPGYDLEHWKVSPSGCGAADRSKCRAGDPVDHAVTSVKVGDWGLGCGPSSPTFPVRRFAQYATQYDTARRLDANEAVLTFPDEGTAAAFMANARSADFSRSCGTGSGASHISPGVSTAEGFSWLTTQQFAGSSKADSQHCYLVQVDDRVAVLRINQLSGDTLNGTVGDPTVLRNLAAALDD